MSKKKAILLVILAAVLGIAVGVGATLGVSHVMNTGTAALRTRTHTEYQSAESEIQTAAPIVVHETVASGTCGDHLTWEITAGDLNITGTGDMYDYSRSDPAPWMSFRDEFDFVWIDSGVTSIGDYAFYKCSGLAAIDIPDSVTRIGDYAFYSCTAADGFMIPSSVTSIGRNALTGSNVLS